MPSFLDVGDLYGPPADHEGPPHIWTGLDLDFRDGRMDRATYL
jgi:hypothetical protein